MFFAISTNNPNKPCPDQQFFCRNWQISLKLDLQNALTLINNNKYILNFNYNNTGEKIIYRKPITIYTLTNKWIPVRPTISEIKTPTKNENDAIDNNQIAKLTKIDHQWVKVNIEFILEQIKIIEPSAIFAIQVAKWCEKNGYQNIQYRCQTFWGFNHQYQSFIPIESEHIEFLKELYKS